MRRGEADRRRPVAEATGRVALPVACALLHASRGSLDSPEPTFMSADAK